MVRVCPLTNIVTLYNVCSVHRGMFSTSGGVQYIGGISWVHRGGYHEYIGGISWVHRGMFSTSGGYHDECGGIPWVHRGMFSTSEGYHEYIGGISWVHRGMFSTSEGYHDKCGGALDKILSISVENSDVLNIPRCTEHPPMYSWYPPDVLMVSPRCTEHPPMYWTSPDVLNIPRCTEHTLYRVIVSIEKSDSVYHKYPITLQFFKVQMFMET